MGRKKYRNKKKIDIDVNYFIDDDFANIVINPKQLTDEQKVENKDKKEIKDDNDIQNIDPYIIKIENKINYSMWEEIAKIYKWKKDDIIRIYIIEELILSNNSLPNNMNKLVQSKEYNHLHNNELYTWKQLHSYLKTKQENTISLSNKYNNDINSINNEYKTIINKQKQLEGQLEKVKQERLQIENKQRTFKVNNEKIKEPITKISNLVEIIEEVINENDKTNNEIHKILKNTKNLKNPISEHELQLLLKNMDLVQYYNSCIDSDLHKEINNFDTGLLIDIGMNLRDSCCFLYNIDMMKATGNVYKVNENDEDCQICLNCTPLKTIDLLQEYKIDIDNDMIINENWIAPYLLYIQRFSDIGLTGGIAAKVRKKIKEWKDLHNNTHINSTKQEK